MPRAGLSPAVVIDEAARMADDLGIEAVTLGALARRFDVAVPSLYKHIPGVDGVRREVALRALSEFERALTAAVKPARAGGEDRLAAIAHAYRAFALAHPGWYQAMQRAPAPDDDVHLAAAARLLGIFTDVIAPRGGDESAVIDATRAVRSTLHGFCDLHARGGFGLPRDVDRTFDTVVADLHLIVGHHLAR